MSQDENRKLPSRYHSGIRVHDWRRPSPVTCPSTKALFRLLCHSTKPRHSPDLLPEQRQPAAGCQRNPHRTPQHIPPTVKITLVASQNAITIEALPDQLAIAQKLIGELHRPRKNYRLTYTITEKDGTRRLDPQHFSMVMVPSQRIVLKQGTKVPVVAAVKKADNGPENQVTYIDMGMNFDATLNETGKGIILRTKVEQLSVSDERSGIGSQDPILHQTALESTSSLTLGKSAMLGSLDIPGTTRHLDVEATIELAQ